MKIKVYEPKRYSLIVGSLKVAHRVVNRLVMSYEADGKPYRIVIDSKSARVTFRSDNND